jgi:hypothetical protein
VVAPRGRVGGSQLGFLLFFPMFLLSVGFGCRSDEHFLCSCFLVGFGRRSVEHFLCSAFFCLFRTASCI